MHRSNTTKPHLESSRLRKYREIHFHRSRSHSLNHSHRKSPVFELNRNESTVRDRFVHDSLLHSFRREDAVFPEERENPGSVHQQSQERRPGSASRSWRKLRNAIMLTSTTRHASRKVRDNAESNDAFLDYFSTFKRPIQNSYYEQQNSIHRNDASKPRAPIEDHFYFEGFNKLADPEPITKQVEPPEDSVFPPPISPRARQICTSCDEEVEVQISRDKPLQIHHGAVTCNSHGSIESVPIQLEEWGGLEERCPPDPRISHTTYKTRWYDHIWFLNTCFPKRVHFSKSTDSCYVNPSEDLNLFSRVKSTHFICNPQGTFMFIWLGIVAMATLYNFWTAILRQAFDEVQHGRTALWIGLDGLADLIYLVDILVQFRTSYLEKGLVVRDARKIATRYLWSRKFAFDSLALLPFDLFQSVTGIQPLLRFPRFLKCFRAWHWKGMVENRTTFPNSWRVLTLTHILFLGCHWFAAIYYILSENTHFADPWGYPAPTTPELQSLLRKYLQCFYWATVTLTTIGDIAEPSLTFQYAFTITTYLIGVFVFATIVGQVGNIINNRNAARLSFENILDNAKSYMSAHHVPQKLRSRVLRWYDYAWERRRLFGENDLNCLGHLPEKLKTELALHVHLETLKKVTIFHECRPEFLHDLVLKMRPYIFTPGDLICRKGEVAREMFIIADGVLEVIGRGGIVLKRLEAGDFFGEIGILCINGGANKRTADVRAVGYAELFVLSREDVLAALSDHPDAHAIIMEHATQRLMESKFREDAQATVSKQTMDPTLSDMLKSTSDHTHRESRSIAGSVSAVCQIPLPGPSRTPGFGSSVLLSSNPSSSPSIFPQVPNSIAVATSTPGSPTGSEIHQQAFATKKESFMRRQKQVRNSITDLHRFVDEAMFLVSVCSERIAARDEKIHELMVENASLIRKMKE
ncbi:hypothetical protein Aperf_G00000029930 [Anoplocephala perfoliata]